MSNKLTSEKDIGPVNLTVGDQAKLAAKPGSIGPKKGLGNVNMSVDHQGKLKDKPGSSQTTESTADLERQYPEDLALFTGSFRDQIIEMNVDAAVLHEALSSGLCLLLMYENLISFSSITFTELERFFLVNKRISGALSEKMKAHARSQQEMKRFLLGYMLRTSYRAMINPRKMIHMAQSHENQSIYDSLCSGFIDHFREKIPSDARFPIVRDYITPKKGLGNVNLSVDEQAKLKEKPGFSQNLGNVDHQAKLKDKPGSSQSAESTADLERQYQEDLAPLELPSRDEMDLDDVLYSFDSYRAVCTAYLNWNTRYQNDLALFTDSVRDQIIQMNVDADDLHEALSSYSYLRSMCRQLISLSSITSTELEMFLLKNGVITGAKLKNIKANTDSQQKMKDELLREMRILLMISPRKILHMAQSHEKRSIFESLCSGFIDHLRQKQVRYARKYWNFGSGNMNFTVDDQTISQPKPSSSKTAGETTLEKVNASLDHRAKLEGKPGTSQSKRAKNIPSETKSIKIGKDGGEIEVGGSFVRFEPGTFNDVETITVTARLDPGEWPTGREAVTSTLDIRAKNLQKKATLGLHTWLVADNEYADIDIMCYKECTKKWELFSTSSVGDSGFIEFQSQHFSKWIALLRNVFSNTYRMRPIICFKSRDFILALVKDAPLERKQLFDDLKEDYGRDLVTHKINPITCRKEGKVECCIEALPDHFQFLDSATFTHNVKNIIKHHAMSYFKCQLECNSDCPSTSSQEIVPRTIRITLKVDGNQLDPPERFSYKPSQPDSVPCKTPVDLCLGTSGSSVAWVAKLRP